MPRHFVQTAAPAGFVEARVRALFEELLATLPAALDKTLASLPPDFPAPLAESIANGLRQRSRRMEQYLCFARIADHSKLVAGSKGGKGEDPGLPNPSVSKSVSKSVSVSGSQSNPIGLPIPIPIPICMPKSQLTTEPQRDTKVEIRSSKLENRR
jgi:hypothetical protein